MSHFGDLSIFNAANLTENSSSQDQNNHSFDKWINQTRNNTYQNNQRTPQALAQNPSTAPQNISEIERFTREMQKINTPYILYKRIVNTTRPQSEGGESGRGKAFAYPKSTLKFTAPPSSQRPSEYALPVDPDEEGSKQTNEQDKEDSAFEKHTPNTSPYASKQASHTESKPEVEDEPTAEDNPEPEKQPNSNSQNTTPLTLKRKREQDSDHHQDQQEDSDPSSNEQGQPRASSSSVRTDHSSAFIPITAKQGSNQKGAQKTKEEAIAASLEMDPQQLIGLAAELLLDQGPFGHMARSIAGFCINAAIHAHGAWQTYIALDQKILAETTLFMQLTTFELLLRFKTSNTLSMKLIEKYEKKLQASVSLVLEHRGYPRVVKVVLADW